MLNKNKYREQKKKSHCIHDIELPFNIKRGLGIPFTGRGVVVMILR
jgi:hypothetical protein